MTVYNPFDFFVEDQLRVAFQLPREILLPSLVIYQNARPPLVHGPASDLWITNFRRDETGTRGICRGLRCPAPRKSVMFNPDMRTRCAGRLKKTFQDRRASVRYQLELLVQVLKTSRFRRTLRLRPI